MRDSQPSPATLVALKKRAPYLFNSRTRHRRSPLSQMASNSFLGDSSSEMSLDNLDNQRAFSEAQRAHMAANSSSFDSSSEMSRDIDERKRIFEHFLLTQGSETSIESNSMHSSYAMVHGVPHGPQKENSSLAKHSSNTSERRNSPGKRSALSRSHSSSSSRLVEASSNADSIYTDTSYPSHELSQNKSGDNLRPRLHQPETCSYNCLGQSRHTPGPRRWSFHSESFHSDSIKGQSSPANFSPTLTQQLALAKQQLAQERSDKEKKLLEKEVELAKLEAEKARELSAKDKELAVKDKELAAKDKELAVELAAKDKELAVVSAAKDKELAALQLENMVLKHKAEIAVLKAKLAANSGK